MCFDCNNGISYHTQPDDRRYGPHRATQKRPIAVRPSLLDAEEASTTTYELRLFQRQPYSATTAATLKDSKGRQHELVVHWLHTVVADRPDSHRSPPPPPTHPLAPAVDTATITTQSYRELKIAALALSLSKAVQRVRVAAVSPRRPPSGSQPHDGAPPAPQRFRP